ncbi:MAG: hypothetical protein KDA81_15375 [Planctomycetaceae bacterium]|nr:hypothetical protein [Planctomycetaceae bacterium]
MARMISELFRKMSVAGAACFLMGHASAGVFYDDYHEPPRAWTTPACEPAWGYHQTCWRRFPPVEPCPEGSYCPDGTCNTCNQQSDMGPIPNGSYLSSPSAPYAVPYQGGMPATGGLSSRYQIAPESVVPQQPEPQVLPHSQPPLTNHSHFGMPAPGNSNPSQPMGPSSNQPMPSPPPLPGSPIPMQNGPHGGVPGGPTGTSVNPIPATPVPSLPPTLSLPPTSFMPQGGSGTAMPSSGRYGSVPVTVQSAPPASPAPPVTNMYLSLQNRSSRYNVPTSTTAFVPQTAPSAGSDHTMVVVPRTTSVQPIYAASSSNVVARPQVPSGTPALPDQGRYSTNRATYGSPTIFVPGSQPTHPSLTVPAYGASGPPTITAPTPRPYR